MARAFSARTVAVALGVPYKWIDNLLSHNDVPGVTRSRQGVERRIDEEGLLAIECTRILVMELGIPVARAAQIARETLRAGADDEGNARFVSDSRVSIQFPLSTIAMALRSSIVDAVDAAPRLPRGRPAKVGP